MHHPMNNNKAATFANLLRGLLSPRLRFSAGLYRDSVTTRAARTAKSWGMELETFDDNSGLELCFRGLMLLVFAEAKEVPAVA
jgi:hypothetical protein